MAKAEIIPIRDIERAIVALRGQRVMLDEDLAALYGVEVKVLNQSVKRNAERFPEDFMFRLTAEEARRLRSQIVTLEVGRGRHSKYLPLAFTEQGVAMLSSVLRSPRAIEVNIEIMRTFVRLRRLLLANADLARKLAALEKKTDDRFSIVFEAIEELINPSPESKKKIGFVSGKHRK
ncbi:MAG: ORF6N domain-containing protein [Myxococcales bacterium]